MACHKLILLTVAAMAVAAGPRYIIVVPADRAALANAAAVRIHTNLYDAGGLNIEQLSTYAGSDSWSVPLTTNEVSTNITHYWCNWQFDNTNHWTMLTNWGMVVMTNARVRIFNAATTTPDQVLQELGLFRMQTNP